MLRLVSFLVNFEFNLKIMFVFVIYNDSSSSTSTSTQSYCKQTRKIKRQFSCRRP